MSSHAARAQYSWSVDETEARALYRQFLSAWNRRSADAIADLFAEDAVLVGFDGSELRGRAEIASAHKQIFDDHPTGAFVGKVKDTRFLNSDVVILGAIAGMVKPGESDLAPDLNAVQTLVAVKRGGRWLGVHFQTTPAQFHGRPREAQALTEELRKLL